MEAQRYSYDNRKKIGEGTYGVVYKTYDTQLKKVSLSSFDFDFWKWMI